MNTKRNGTERKRERKRKRIRKETIMAKSIEEQLSEIESIKHLLTPDEYETKRKAILAQIGGGGGITAAVAVAVPVEGMANASLAETGEEKKGLMGSLKDTVRDKTFLKGAGVGFLAGAVTGAGITHLVHKNKDSDSSDSGKKKKSKKKKKKKKSRGSSSDSSSSSSSSDSSDSDDSGKKKKSKKKKKKKKSDWDDY